MNDQINSIKEKIDAHIEELMPIYLISYRIYDDDEASKPEKNKALGDMLKSNEILMSIMMHIKKDLSQLKEEFHQ